jgi:hypothetical protein
VTDEPSLSERAEARAAAQKRRAKGRQRREVLFELVVSGYSHHEIAEAMGMSARAVRRVVDSAVAERRLDAPDHYVRVQVARLTKALKLADYRIGKGDLRALAPYVKLIAAMDRYHNVDWRPPRPAPPVEAAALPAPPLALPPPAPPIAPEPEPNSAEHEG